MPELMEQMYCSQQIVIPPKFPYILKRYCKAAIKTQPYDVLRWSFEYFKALAQHRPPPVKLRLEYPVYSTEGGLTRGCLKVLAQQLAGSKEILISSVRAAWSGFCLDPNELNRILCLCDVYMKGETMSFLYFIAAAGGLLTKCLTHTMILLCEALTKEPDGGSAAIPVRDFLIMYNFLARVDASKDTRYMNGYREGAVPVPIEPEEEEEAPALEELSVDNISDDYWKDVDGPVELQRLSLIDAHVARNARLSTRLNAPALGRIERSPSMERAGQVERDNYQRERKGRAKGNEEIDRKLKEFSEMKFSMLELQRKEDIKQKEDKTAEKKKEGVEIYVYDDDEVEQPYDFYGEPPDIDEEYPDEDETTVRSSADSQKEGEPDLTEAQRVQALIAELYDIREERLENLERTMDEIAAIVDKFNTANYDLGMIAGRQMSTTSGEFIVQHIEKEIMTYIDEQIAILPDPDLKKKKAKPDEVAMVRELLEAFLDENMHVIVPEIEEVEEEETPIPEITLVYAVPGIGPPVDEEIIREFEDYALDVCKVQADLFMPRNIRHFLCPPLEKYAEHKYELDDIKTKEEVATGGVITD